METNALIKLAELHTAFTGGSEATISNKITTNARLFDRLREDKGCTVTTFNNAMRWFDEHWPADLAWPADVPRPSSKGKAA
ncbi:hypothetical protein LGQ03_04885 [Loktanella sp. TSTF-M6]|uniref:Uncharacterized protein n=1 Tax=Loktanella gaetbuli TaxID=2881335 RepID=A0ABS8BS72_9RHOB|nr:hypothetical protein [Loktanella gaetbuli]MCB5198566.1 hypothetical protein [Loktanella gaetbuli]